MADALVVAPTGFFWQAAPKPLDVRIYGEFQLAGALGSGDAGRAST